MGIEDMIKPVSILQGELSALFYGKSGTGKTTLAATFPKPLLVLDIKEKGTDSIANVEGVFYASITSWDEFVEAYWYIQKNPTKFKTVVIDQISHLQAILVQKVKSDANKGEKDLMNRKEWGQVSTEMTTWLYAYRDLTDLGINVVFLAHDRITSASDEEIEDNGIDPSVGARLMPSVAGSLNGAVKIVGQTFIRMDEPEDPDEKSKPEYCLRVGPHPYYTTKIRTPRSATTPSWIVDPSYEKIVNTMAGKSTVRKVIRKE